MISRAVANTRRTSALSRSCNCSLKPPAVPRPRTGGGGSAMMKASSMTDRFWIMLRMTTSTVSPWAARSRNGVKRVKIAPALGALVKVAPENPENATALHTPGVFKRISVARRMTASVRASEAPSGSCTTTMP